MKKLIFLIWIIFLACCKNNSSIQVAQTSDQYVLVKVLSSAEEKDVYGQNLEVGNFYFFTCNHQLIPVADLQQNTKTATDTVTETLTISGPKVQMVIFK